MNVRVLNEADATQFRRLRRQRLEQDPRAFSESPAEHDSIPMETMAAGLRHTSGGYFVIGAFSEEGRLVGMAGFSRNARIKLRHKGIIWGVFVEPQWRGKGAGRAVLEALIRRARAEPGLEQIVLSVAARQNAARHLYESLGFEVFGHERHALKIDGEYVDEDHMVLALKRDQPMA